MQEEKALTSGLIKQIDEFYLGIEHVVFGHGIIEDPGVNRLQKEQESIDKDQRLDDLSQRRPGAGEEPMLECKSCLLLLDPV